MTTETTVPDVPSVDIDFNRLGFVDDPYPELRRLQDLAPVLWHEEGQHYLVTRHRDIARILGNPTTYGSDHDFFINLFGGATMEAMDGIRHDEVRGIWATQFQRPSLEQQRELVTEIVRSRLDPFLERMLAGETADAVSGMTRAIPTLVIATMLGIPREHYAQFGAWSDAMGGIAEGFSDPTERGAQLVAEGKAATAALNEFVHGELEKRRAAGDASADLVAAIAHHPVAQTMTEAEIIASVTQLVFAGNETTAKLMSLTLLALAAHPEQRRALVTDRSLIPAAIEEVHRWSTIVHRARRVVQTDDAVVAGVPLPRGTHITCLQGVANRDPSRWENPDDFDIFRKGKQHLGFGFGMHSCLGLNLARLEVQVWLDRLLDVLPDWEIAGDVDWGTNWVLRGPLSVPMRAERAS